METVFLILRKNMAHPFRGLPMSWATSLSPHIWQYLGGKSTSSKSRGCLKIGYQYPPVMAIQFRKIYGKMMESDIKWWSDIIHGLLGPLSDTSLFQKNTMGMKHDPFPSHRPGVSKHIRPRITPGISWKLTLHTFQGREIIQNVLTVNLVWDSRGKNCEAPFQFISTESGRWFSMVFHGFPHFNCVHPEFVRFQLYGLHVGDVPGHEPQKRPSLVTLAELGSVDLLSGPHGTPTRWLRCGLPWHVPL